MPKSELCDRIVVATALNYSIPDASVERLPERRVTPLELQRVEALRRHAADLQRRVHVEVLVEGRDLAGGLAVDVVELGRRAVLVLHHGGRLAEVDDHAHILAVPEDVDAVPVTVVEAVLGLDPQLERPGAKVDEQSA